MSIRVMDAVWKLSRAKSGDLLVALAIADFSNDQGLAFPAIKTLAQKARLSPRQVKRAIDRLHRLGELTIYKKKGPNGVNRYRIILGDKLSPKHTVKVTSTTGQSDILGKKVVTPMSPNPSEEPLENLGEDFATQSGELRPISEAVLKIMNKYVKAGLLKESA